MFSDSTYRHCVSVSVTFRYWLVPDRPVRPKSGKKIRTIDKKTMELFHAYDWPGNIRELQNVVERAVILSEGENLLCRRSLAYSRNSQGWLRPLLSAAHGPCGAREGHDWKVRCARLRALVSGPTGAATKLGVPRQTLESKIRKLGINRQSFQDFVVFHLAFRDLPSLPTYTTFSMGPNRRGFTRRAHRCRMLSTC